MGNRLTKIYTRTGDAGTTGLGTGDRVPKDHLRVEAYGTVDELNSQIGVLLATPGPGLPDGVRQCLVSIQHRLFDLGGELCMPGHTAIDAAAVTRLEESLDAFNADLPALKDFILPGGSPAAAACHVARTVCRRAERRCWTLAGEDKVNEHGLKYLNRLSDLLFVMARSLNKEAGVSEPLWQKNQL
ncbi:MAG: cob(I)yrinic acid a,c-diamide adenosyltransferase [Gammaproteobacteria bacterium]